MTLAHPVLHHEDGKCGSRKLPMPHGAEPMNDGNNVALPPLPPLPICMQNLPCRNHPWCGGRC